MSRLTMHIDATKLGGVSRITVVFQNSGNHHPESDAIKLQDLLDQSQAGPLRTLPRSSFFLTEARSKKCTFSYPLYSLPY